jgi:hypothetical protein
MSVGLPTNSPPPSPADELRSGSDDQGRRVSRQGVRVRRLAEQTRDPYLKEQFLKIAQEWWTMAAYEEKHAR